MRSRVHFGVMNGLLAVLILAGTRQVEAQDAGEISVAVAGGGMLGFGGLDPSKFFGVRAAIGCGSKNLGAWLSLRRFSRTYDGGEAEDNVTTVAVAPRLSLGRGVYGFVELELLYFYRDRSGFVSKPDVDGFSGGLRAGLGVRLADQVAIELAPEIFRASHVHGAIGLSVAFVTRSWW